MIHRRCGIAVDQRAADKARYSASQDQQALVVSKDVTLRNAATLIALQVRAGHQGDQVAITGDRALREVDSDLP